jgi:predicted phage baseplate assembly protein
VIPELRLDARGHDELTEQARAQLALACPELSTGAGGDPAGTLIELFSWMTELAIDRLGQVPDKLHIALLEILGVQLDGPAAARTGIRMRLSAPASEPLEIVAGTEVGTLRTASHESIVFTTQRDFTILPLRPTAYVVQRAGVAKEIGVSDGVAYPPGREQLPFSSPPQTGDALCLGFENSVGSLLLRVSLEASTARGAGVKPEDPPLRWEASQGEGVWGEVEVLEDLTGGFNYGSGTIELQCPPASAIEPLAGRRLHWLRCRIAETTRISGEPAIYTHPPEIYSITASPLGALLPAEHSAVEFAELLGVSDGSPAQAFGTRYSPVLGLAAEETLEVEVASADWEPWEEQDTFAGSGPDDRHYVLDRVAGQIRLGPELRDRDGGTSQWGAIPPKGAAVRMSRYRHGGGLAGNVDAGRLATLRSAIPGVASVTNPEPARGGVDAQSLQSLRDRSALEIRTRYRAVTAEDFEFLATEATPRVARAQLVADQQPGVTLRILPRIDPADRRLPIDELTPAPALLDEVERYLDARKLVGTPVRLEPMRFRGVAVVVNIEASARADLQRIEREVRRALYGYLNPLIGGTAGAVGLGWPAGRSLNQGELYAIVHGFEGVEFVRVLRLYEVDLLTGEQASKAAGRQIVIEPDEVIASGEHLVRVTRREP